MCDRKPTCGSQGAAVEPNVSSIASDITTLIGLIGTANTLIGLLAKTAIFTFLGIAAPAVLWLGAVAGGLITFAVVFDFYRLRCLASPDTRPSCSAGVIQGVVPSFNSATDELFPFTATHDRVDVVVKCDYWFLVETNAGFVHCSADADASPILRGYHRSDKVCAAGLGSTIGAGAGLAGGILLGALAAAAIGCATIILCLLAILVALVIAAAVVLAGAFVGGQIGKAAAGDDAPAAEEGSELRSGDYVTTQGGLLTSGEDEGARVYWFVDRTILHGRSMLSPPFSHRDPDANLTSDACPTRPIIK